MSKFPAPVPPQGAPSRWAWERFYTSTVEHLMAARSGERLLKPSEVAETAKARTIAAYLKATGESSPPSWLAHLGEPPNAQGIPAPTASAW